MKPKQQVCRRSLAWVTYILLPSHYWNGVIITGALLQPCNFGRKRPLPGGRPATLKNPWRRLAIRFRLTFLKIASDFYWRFHIFFFRKTITDQASRKTVLRARSTGALSNSAFLEHRPQSTFLGMQRARDGLFIRLEFINQRDSSASKQTLVRLGCDSALHGWRRRKPFSKKV